MSNHLTFKTFEQIDPKSRFPWVRTKCITRKKKLSTRAWILNIFEKIFGHLVVSESYVAKFVRC
jgi:hypothetical protein